MINSGTKYDIHPGDTLARVKVRDTLRQLRVKEGLTSRDLSLRYSPSDESQSIFERGYSWHVGTVQRVSRALNRVFWMIPQLPETNLVGDDIVENDINLTILSAARVRTIEDWDYLHAAWVRSYLTAIRRESVEVGVFARRLNVSAKAVTEWERTDTDPYLHFVQRYTRGLGGSLKLAIWPEKPIGEADPRIGALL